MLVLAPFWCQFWFAKLPLRNADQLVRIYLSLDIAESISNSAIPKSIQPSAVLTTVARATPKLKPGQIYICMTESVGPGAGGRFFRSCLQSGTAAAFDFFPSARQAGEKVAHLLLHRGTSAQAPVGGRLLIGPAPDGLVSVEIGRFPHPCRMLST